MWGNFTQFKEETLTPIERLCKVDEVVDDLDEVYEKLKP